MEKTKTTKKNESKTLQKKPHRAQTSNDDQSLMEPLDTQELFEMDGKNSKKSKKRRKNKIHKCDGLSSCNASEDISNSGSSSKLKGTRENSRKKNKEISNSSSSSSPGSSEVNINARLQRDDWMTDSTLLVLKNFSRERMEKKPKEKQPFNAYNPAKCARELNPYWRTTGTGIPAFQKPKEDSDNDAMILISPPNDANAPLPKNWLNSNTNVSLSERKRSFVAPTSGISASKSEEDLKPGAQFNQILTDQQMNELGAKILKAEIMGNTVTAEELKNKLESARVNRATLKVGAALKPSTKDLRSERPGVEEHILLTHSDLCGNSRPLALASQAKTVDQHGLAGGRREHKKPKNRTSTHVDGERVRYFADDDKYDIKEMFEREKYSSALDMNLELASIASKSQNPNDNLEDIFIDNIRRNISSTETERYEVKRAVWEHQREAVQLNNCDKCLNSVEMDKKCMVSMGDKVYLALPYHIGLQIGHCVIVPIQHVSCSLQLDENVWEEITNYRKALTRMFAAQRKDVIFFEVANRLHRCPHLCIHCVPIPENQSEMAPFFFKKAIEESEREWSVNKQLVSLRNKSLRSAIPKGLPYFWVHFGLDCGFAHVIEDEDRFPANFAQEIIAGMLHLETKKWRKPTKEHNIITKVKIFTNWWQQYDFSVVGQ